MKRLILPLLLIAACRNEPVAMKASAPAKPAAAAVPATPYVKDPHSYARPDEVKVDHIALDLNVDFAKKQLIGEATLKFLRNDRNATELVLDTSDLDIRSVTLQPGNATAQFTLAPPDPILGRALTVRLSPETTAVRIEYATSPAARALQWLDPAQTSGKKHPFLLSQSESILARTWVPLQDSPQVRFTYDATLHVPKELLALMSAENPQARNEEGVYQFRMEQPIPAYLLAIAVGDIEFRPLDTRSGVYAEPEVVDAAAREFSDTPKMIHAAEQLYGPYRWGRYDVLVLPPSFPYGGMENPRLTFVTPTVIAGDKSLVSLIAHELAHSWTGNLVTNATWDDFWLNEGFTTYAEHRITENLYGRPYAEMLWLLGLTDVKTELSGLPPADQHLHLNFAGRDPDDEPGIVYEKGALFLRLLEETAGRPRFDAFLRKYIETFTFKPMTTTAFVAFLQAELPDVAKKVNVDEWLYGPGLPANAPKPQSQAFVRVEEQAKSFAGGAAASSVKTDGWTTHEWVHFIQSLPAIGSERMAALDARFHFSDSRNSEILFAWLKKSVDERYAAVNPAVERFLTSQGRRRFIIPIYMKLAGTPEGLAFARKVYAKARPMYHPLAQTSVDQLLQAKK